MIRPTPLSICVHARPCTPEGRPPSETVRKEDALPRSFTLDEHKLAMRLGVHLRAIPRPVCHGYANGCACPACKNQERAINAHRTAGRHPFDHEGKVKAPPAKRQPWETERAA